MRRASLVLPPAPAESDLPLDKEFLQRWSLGNTPSGTPAANTQRSPSFPRRQASFDSPREIPMPSSSSISSASTLTSTPAGAPMTNSYISKRAETSPGLYDSSGDYFSSMPHLRHSSLACHEGRPYSSSPPPYPSSSGSGSSSSRCSKGGQYRNGAEDEYDDDSSNTGSGSDSTNQTSPSPSPHSGSPEDQQPTGPMMASHIGNAPCPDLASNSSRFPSEPGISAFGNSMMSSLSSATPLRNPATNNVTFGGPSGSGSRFSANTALSSGFNVSRPLSLPESHSNLYTPSNLKTMDNMTWTYDTNFNGSSGTLPSYSGWPDRSSSTSLPLPKQIPFHILPRTGPASTPGTSLEEALAGTWDPSAAAAHAERVRSMHEMETGRRPRHTYQPNSTHWTVNNQNDTGTSNSQDFQGPPPQSHASRYGSQRTTSPSPHHRPFTAPNTSAHVASHSHYHTQSQHSPPRAEPADVSVIFPPPEPPTIIAPTVVPAPFLSHGPPPADSWIEVDTIPTEYRLTVRLPGFSRDGITLATKRRRILHVVADSWENGGGHFERRIAFGYDADLAQVRAEFDGEILRITIPRRLSPVELRVPRPGPVGRPG